MRHRLLTRLLNATAPTIVPILRGPLRGARWVARSTSPRFWLTGHESGIMANCCANLTPHAVAYDVGANVGAYSLLLARAGAVVHAFEPDPANVLALRQHLRLNGLTATIVESAVSDHDGHGCLSIGQSHAEGRLSDTGLPVTTLTLDHYALTHTAPTFIKVDVEGAEVKVLDGATSLMRTHRPTWLIEAHTRDLLDACAQRLHAFGYTTSIDGVHLWGRQLAR